MYTGLNVRLVFNLIWINAIHVLVACCARLNYGRLIVETFHHLGVGADPSWVRIPPRVWLGIPQFLMFLFTDIWRYTASVYGSSISGIIALQNRVSFHYFFKPSKTWTFWVLSDRKGLVGRATLDHTSSGNEMNSWTVGEGKTLKSLVENALHFLKYRSTDLSRIHWITES